MIREFLIGVGSSIASSSVVLLILSHQPAMFVFLGIGIAIVAGSIKSRG